MICIHLKTFDDVRALVDFSNFAFEVLVVNLLLVEGGYFLAVDFDYFAGEADCCCLESEFKDADTLLSVVIGLFDYFVLFFAGSTSLFA